MKKLMECFMPTKDNDGDEGSDIEVIDQNPSYDDLFAVLKKCMKP